MLFAVCFPLQSARAADVALSISPAKGEFAVGSVFTVSVQLDTRQETAGFVSATLAYPPDIVQVVDPGAGSSFITSWHTAPLVSNFDGTLTFAGEISPGIKTSGGTVLTVSFRAVSPGTATLAFTDVRIQSALERGHALDVQRASAAYRTTIAPSGGPRLESPTHPSADAWSLQPEATFVWGEAGGGTYRYLFNQEPSASLEGEKEHAGSSLTVPLERDGLWYMHLSVKAAAGSWSEPTHYAVRVDRTAPRKPEVFTSREDRDGAAQYRITFSASDAMSGVERYQARVIPPDEKNVSQGFFTEVSSPLFLTNPKEGVWHVSVRAYDRAGNFSEAEEVLSVAGSRRAPIVVLGVAIPRSNSWLTAYALALIALGALTLLAYEFVRHHRDVRKKFLRDTETTEQKLKRSLADVSQRYGENAQSLQVQQAIDALHAVHSAPSPPPPPPPA